MQYKIRDKAESDTTLEVWLELSEIGELEVWMRDNQGRKAWIIRFTKQGWLQRSHAPCHMHGFSYNGEGRIRTEGEADR